jgi:SRSO17 transposase
MSAVCISRYITGGRCPWSDAAVLESVRGQVLAAMRQNGPLVAWIVDDIGFVKEGTHSVGVARQYCGQVGKKENCRVAVSLSVSTYQASLPIAWRLNLPESGTKDMERRKASGVPKEITLQTKPAIAFAQIEQTVEQGVPLAPVLADSAYGNETRFRERITELGLRYVVGVHDNLTVWRPEETPRLKPRRKGRGRPPTRWHREAQHQPLTLKDLAFSVPERAWKVVTWREGTHKKKLKSRFTEVRIRPAHRDEKRSELYPEEWLLIEWPVGEPERTKYWFSTLPANTIGRNGETGQTPLDPGARLRRTEAGIGTGTLRRSWLARVSSSRHPRYCRLRVPGDRADPFFPLSPRR